MALPDTPTYKVIETSDQTVTIWDGLLKEKWGSPTGTMTLAIGPHMFEVGDRVSLVLRKETT